jgi:hypothetical protein
MRYRNATATTAVLFGVLLGLLTTGNALAAAFETIGNAPLSEENFKVWKGIMTLVNDKRRVYALSINGNERLYYASNVKELNAALNAYSKVESATLTVVICPGPATRDSSERKAINYNWELHLIGGLAATRKANNDPVLTIYIDAGIPLDNLVIPHNLTLQVGAGPPGVKVKNEALRLEIEEYLKTLRSSQ